MERHAMMAFEIMVPAGVVAKLAERGDLGGYRGEWVSSPWVTADIRVDASDMALYVTRPELGESVWSEYRHPSHEPDAWVPRPRKISFAGFSVTPDGARELLMAAHFPGDAAAFKELSKALGLVPWPTAPPAEGQGE